MFSNVFRALEDHGVDTLGIRQQMRQFWGLVEDSVLSVQWGMSEALVIQALKDKRAEIRGRIVAGL